MKLSVLCLMLLTVPAVSTGSTLTFDEFGITPAIGVNGLKMPGVLFGFTPGQATYNGTIGTSGTSGNAVFSIDPVLMGPTTGTLDLTFTYLTPLLQFDIVLQSIFPIDDSSSGPDGGPAYTVLLSNGTTLTGSTTPQPDGFYSEGQFQYSGDAISGATITFFSGSDAGGSAVQQFGLDNLTFVAPEPATNLLIAVGLIALER
jgi:hypothetical protein